MPARFRSKLYYQQALHSGFSQAEFDKYHASEAAHEIHLRNRPFKAMRHNTVETKHGIFYSRYFSAPNAQVSHGEKTEQIVSNHP
jgi:hypothetical protein